MELKIIRTFILGVLFIGLVVACSSSSDDGPTGPSDTFDRGALLTNLADNIIIPAFEDLNTNLGALKTSKEAFVASPNQNNLDALRTSWLSAYKSWQFVEMFNIGKAEEIAFGFQMNVYPTNTEDIENNIANGTYDLTHVNNNDAVGFPTVDYLLYGVAGDDTAILAKYNDAKYITYLSDVIDQMKSLTETVLNDWKGSYRNAFISQTGNTTTSALNKLTNDFVFYFEKGLRANKIGIPAGNFSATPLPEKVEAFYAKSISKELALEALEAVQDFFNGNAFSNGASGESFKSYLVHVERNDLATLINSRLNDAEQKIQALNADFTSQINSDNTKMTQAYDALQMVVVSLKVDMLQAFNISVDYVDADGD
ncbi:imelysin family protein [Hyunsoonleella sp. SJ7]|uniref:Imelysin family protein n=1 Tax=Hyunsoonleella aquatilis TaxID=2762758 RepID=A0A923H7X4_9FLAO|nr:imelysin family protein [Hyunsoonleella aquatilis]MBC3757810.1 imelysin family protein [Hyunsoonleella aquatilis]